MNYSNENMENRYVFIFDYGSDWMIICYNNEFESTYFNSADNDWEYALNYARLFLKAGGNEYYYKLPNYDCVADIDVFKLKDKSIIELNKYLLC